nr:hypothetical protein [Thermobaculum terrenum]
MTLPPTSTSGPPELPGTSDTSDWMNDRGLRSALTGPTAVTTPAVITSLTPKGDPAASTSWPTRTEPESPTSTLGKSRKGMESAARSRLVSLARRVPRTSSPDRVRTSASCWGTTWLLVTTRPLGAQMMPEPTPWRERIITTRSSSLCDSSAASSEAANTDHLPSIA